MAPLEGPKKNAATPTPAIFVHRRRSRRYQLVAMVVNVAAFVFVVGVVVVVGVEAIDSHPATFLSEEDNGGDGDGGIMMMQQRIPTQFIAALGDPKASSGTGAEEWGIWTLDPGPRGVRLVDFAKRIQSSTTTTATTTENVVVGPHGWKFDTNDWWLEEHGLVMEQPEFPLPPARYVVTGGRETTSILTIDDRGHWNLKDGASLYDVTHLPCRSARYRNTSSSSSSSSQDAGTCSPTKAQPSKFPVRPGASMPHVDGCDKQDYAVIFVIGKEVPVPAQQQQPYDEPPSISNRYDDQDSL